MMFPTVVACGCEANYYPNQAFVNGEPQPSLVLQRPCMDHKDRMDGRSTCYTPATEDLAMRWALHDAKRAFDADEYKDEPWRAPAPKRVKWPEGARWWHRLRGHHTRARYDFCFPSYAWQCLECAITIGHC